jgi:hypothetical protein
MKYLLLIVILLLLGACSSPYDPHVDAFNISYTASVYEVDLNFSQVPDNNYAMGDFYLVKARLTGEGYSGAVKYYNKAINEEQGRDKALLYETLATITGNKFYYFKAYKIWAKLGNKFRSDMALSLMFGKDPSYSFEHIKLTESFMPVEKGVQNFAIGGSSFFVDREDILVSQVDRVTRDWLSSQLQHPESSNLLTIFSEGYDVEEIGWHEGGRITKYIESTNLTHKTAVGTVVRKINGTWYAPNEKGVFMFEVPIDKVQYPTTRFYNENLALIIDTHGVNMLVKQAIEQNASVVMGCCDHPGKIAAALYLNSKGIKVICNTDKYLPLAIGQTNTTLGSVPFYESGDKIQFGAQTVEINVKEKIVVMNATDSYGLSYYSTPSLYFSTLQRKTTLPLDLIYVTISDYEQMNTVVNVAMQEGASVIAARVYDQSDYLALSKWLDSSQTNRVILFHSEPYPYGYKLLREYTFQVSFDDPKPIFY